MTVSLRAARSTDAGRVGALLSEFVDTTDWMPALHSRAQDIAHAGKLIDRGWVTVADAPPVLGFLARDRDEVIALYVASAARNSGIGSTLLRAAQQQTDRLVLWTFQANHTAQQFYLKHGFTETARTDGLGNDENLPDVHYCWERSST